VLAELPHERYAELADLVVGLALGVEVASSLSTTHVQTGKGILEDLLETQELEDGQVDRRVQPETALVGTESRVELDAVALVDVAVALVVFPDNAELDDALGNGDDLESLLVLGVLLEDGGALKGGGELWKELARCRKATEHNCALFEYETSPNGSTCVKARTLVGLLKLRLRHCGKVW
jgi:hypothetical protein